MTMNVWDLLSIIGSIAFALSGAIVAMEEDFDILGIFILGFVTAFGGGAIRNLLIGLPISALWSQSQCFYLPWQPCYLSWYFQISLLTKVGEKQKS